MPTNSLNPNSTVSRNTPKSSSGKSKDFDFCVVCLLNHDQGSRHKYFPNHKKALYNYLARFKSKLADVRFFLKNPCVLRPEHASRNRLWCVFCDSDIQEPDSPFACFNAITHLAGAEHLKNMKHFMWKHGGSMDKLDDFRISDADLSKWKKNCALLERDTPAYSEGSQWRACGSSNNIQIEQSHGFVDNYVNNFISPLFLSYSNGVMPLQCTTIEHEISGAKSIGGANSCRLPNNGSSVMSVDKCVSNGLRDSETATSSYPLPESVQIMNVVTSRLSNVGSVTIVDGYGRRQGDVQGNVHSGGAPPWLDASERSQIDSYVNAPSSSTVLSSSSSKKSKKSNPKRVGAAWAEKRKIELEMERRGEVVKSIEDVNWLPNFGRVWQSGSRKESRKEFEKEKRKFSDIESHPAMPADIQPYISKRMNGSPVSNNSASSSVVVAEGPVSCQKPGSSRER